jgi:hypothetical protein
MQLTPDCIRDVLLELETFHIGVYKVDSFQNCLLHYSSEQILYTLIKLYEGAYINAQLIRSSDGQLITFRVYDMTFQGHEFLEKIRSDTVWNQKLKPVFTTIGSMSLEVISSVANSAITSLVLAKLGL